MHNFRFRHFVYHVDGDREALSVALVLHWMPWNYSILKMAFLQIGMQHLTMPTDLQLLMVIQLYNFTATVSLVFMPILDLTVENMKSTIRHESLN
ncbi:hypothetical protein D3C79_834010 [compost metagenome]